MRINLNSILLLIIFLPEILLSQEYHAYVKRSLKWPSKEIHVSWINPTDANAPQRRVVAEAIKETWEKESSLQFIWCSNEDNHFGIRIKISDEGPHTNNLGIHLNDSPVGMTLNFDF